jgi:hypothetical protein
METKGNGKRNGKDTGTTGTTASRTLPMLGRQENVHGCDFTGYNADTLMNETAKLRKLITRTKQSCN